MPQLELLPERSLSQFLWNFGVGEKGLVDIYSKNNIPLSDVDIRVFEHDRDKFGSGLFLLRRADSRRRRIVIKTTRGRLTLVYASWRSIPAWGFVVMYSQRGQRFLGEYSIEEIRAISKPYRLPLWQRTINSLRTWFSA